MRFKAAPKPHSMKFCTHRVNTTFYIFLFIQFLFSKAISLSLLYRKISKLKTKNIPIRQLKYVEVFNSIQLKGRKNPPKFVKVLQNYHQSWKCLVESPEVTFTSWGGGPFITRWTPCSSKKRKKCVKRGFHI